MSQEVAAQLDWFRQPAAGLSGQYSFNMTAGKLRDCTSPTLNCTSNILDVPVLAAMTAEQDASVALVILLMVLLHDAVCGMTLFLLL